MIIILQPKCDQNLLRAWVGGENVRRQYLSLIRCYRPSLPVIFYTMSLSSVSSSTMQKWNNNFCDLRIHRALTLKSVISSQIYIHGWWRCWTLVSRWARQKDNRRLMEHHHRPPDRQRRCWRWKEWQGITCPMTIIGQGGWCDDNSEAENKTLSEWLTN